MSAERGSIAGEASRMGAEPSHVLSPAAPEQRSTRKRLKALSSAIPDRADVILLGDSLAAGWPARMLSAIFPGHAVFNFGVPGERIQNTLWRLENVDTGHLAPRWAIILLGTNNLGDGDPAEAIAAGLSAVATKVRQLWHEPCLLLFTVPPRGASPRFREHDRIRLNARLQEIWSAENRSVLLDADLAFGPDPLTALDDDRLHLSLAGYDLLTGAIASHLARFER
jgi:lysophospholipase L1-like esterase